MSEQNPYEKNPYGQQPHGQQQPSGQGSGQGWGQQPPGDQPQPGYGYPQQGAQPPTYGYPQQGAPGGPGYQVPPGAYNGDPNAPYGYDPYGRPYSDKSKITAGVLQLFLGTLGIGRFYTGHTGMALGQLFTCGGCGIWALIDGILLLTGDSATDAQGRILRG